MNAIGGQTRRKRRPIFSALPVRREKVFAQEIGFRPVLESDTHRGQKIVGSTSTIRKALHSDRIRIEYALRGLGSRMNGPRLLSFIPRTAPEDPASSSPIAASLQI